MGIVLLNLSLDAVKGGANRVNQLNERKGGMTRLCHVFIVILGLHCLTFVLASAWPSEDGSIIKAILLPELLFWQGIVPNGSSGSHPAWHAGAQMPSR